MDIRKVKKLIEMLESSELEVIEIQEGEESVRLVKKQTETVVSHVTQNLADPVTEKTVIGHSQEALSTIKEADGEVITSPMVGTFYAAPSPGAKPFSEPGDIIKEGDVVCIVEAMKMMNEIKSEFSGTIKKVHLDNADPVEFGQALFTVE